MAKADVLRRMEDVLPFSIFDSQVDGNGKVESRGRMVERKIDLLETMAAQVSNRRSRKWLNDRLLMELVPRLNVEEIRGLFAPPPWGDYKPISPFCMTDVQEWDSFRSIDMDKEVHMIKSQENSMTQRKHPINNEKIIALNAWHRVSCRAREILRRNFHSDIVQGFEKRIQEFITNKGEAVLVLHVQNPFHRLLLHGICEFYDLNSITVANPKDENQKMTKIMKKKSGSQEIPPNVTLAGFIKMAKTGSS